VRSYRLIRIKNDDLSPTCKKVENFSRAPLWGRACVFSVKVWRERGLTPPLHYAFVPQPGFWRQAISRGLQTSLYFGRWMRRFTPLMDFDMNWWGVWAMPVGVAICFGPVIVAWALAEKKSAAETKRNDRR
jgi:hypothetical protein